jgi:hypothetical protein
MWKADNSKVVAPACVGYGSMGWPPRARIEGTNRILVFMGPVSRSSYVTTGPKPLFPTPRMLRGKENEVNHGDGQASLSLVAKTSSGCRGLF